MPDRPHLAFPVRLGRGGALQANEQDSDADVADCIATILSWPRGTRRGDPEFGIPTPDFEALDLAEMEAAVTDAEPRAAHVDARVLEAAMRRGAASVSFGFDQAD